ncbi:MAG: AbrB/MazE/SpoVT family DNA-binding domain-containing protein [Elusimicrobiota bacterium]
MSKLIAVSPVGKNGQTVVPAKIRKLFKLVEGQSLVGFYLNGSHIELAPVSVVRDQLDYTEEELDKVERLAKAPGAKIFKTARAAKAYIKSL